MIIEMNGNRARVKDRPEITITFAEKETEDLIDSVLEILMHATYHPGEVEDAE